nr:diguanylate cyclase [Trueperaceae bacterium]
MTAKMLVVDDHPGDRTLVVRALEREFKGVEVVEAGTPEHLAEAFDRGPYHAAVTDYHLRWSTGLEVLSDIRSRWNVPVVMFTDTGNEEVAAQAFLAGADYYVIKRADSYARLARGVRQALERRAASQQLFESERRYRELADALPDTAVFVFDPRLRLRLAAGSELPRLRLTPADVVGRTVDDLLHDVGDHATALSTAARAALAGDRGRLDVVLRGCEYVAHTTPLRNVDGEIYAGMAMVVNVAHLRGTEATVRQLSQVVEQSPVLVAMTDVEGRIRYVNGRFAEMTGYTPAEAIGRRLEEVPAPVAPFGDETPLRTVRAGGTWCGDVENIKKDGTTYLEAATISPLRDEHGTITAFVKLAEDVTERRALTRHLEFLSLHDDLTGLANRALLLERTSHALHRAKRSGHKVALMFFDLDGFKVYNDSLGRHAGDTVLRAVAVRLVDEVRPEDTVARLASDEFAVLLAEVKDASAASGIAETLREAIARPLTVDAHELVTGASVGIALYPEHASNAEELLTNADLATSHAKTAGRSQTSLFSREVAQGVSSRLSLETALRGALRERQLRLVFQPRIRFADGVVTSFEALVRWDHPEFGAVPPSRFIPLAEESGLIHDVGRVVLDLATTQLSRWRGIGLEPLPVAINVSALELAQDRLAY